MEYTILNCDEVNGGMIALVHIVEAMARHAATGYGRREMHYPTLITTREQKSSLVVNAVSSGDLAVYSCEGHPIKSLPKKAKNTPESEFLLPLRTTKSSLTEWGSKRGDTFVFLDVQTEPIDSDLCKYNADGQVVRVIKPGYYRGYVVSLCYLDQQPAADVADTLLPDAASSGTPDSEAPIEILRSAALVKEFLNIWPSIERDIRDKTRHANALLNEANIKHGYYDVEKALRWARMEGKISNQSAASYTRTASNSVLSSLIGQIYNLN